MKIIDMHCDTISALYHAGKKGEKKELLENDLHIDLKRMQKADYLLQNFAAFVDLRESKSTCQDAKEMIALLKEEIHKNKDSIRLVQSYGDIEICKQEQKVGAMITLEEGNICEGSLERLKEFYDLGARMLTLSWNYPNALGYPNVNADEVDSQNPLPRLTTPDKEHGLTKTGIAFVEEMQRMGMIVDVSHMSDAGFYDVADLSKKPFVASHSDARAVSRMARNMTDDMIRTLAEKGGVMGLNFCMDFLICPDENRSDYLDAVVRHARHIVNVGGMEVLGLGSDFDGIDTNTELPGVQTMPLLADALRKGGFTEREVEQIFSENVLRVYKDTLMC